MDQHNKGSLGPTLDQLRVDVISQANDILERIRDLESRVARIEEKVSFIVFRGKDSDPEIEFVEYTE